LLAVAPVAASAVAVNAADATQSTTTKSTANTTMDFGNSSTLLPSNSDVAIKSTINAIAPAKIGNTTIPGSISGKLTATFGGQSYDANFATATNNATIYSNKDNKEVAVSDMKPGVEYYASLNNVAFNFGSQNANKDVTITISGNNAELKLDSSYVQKDKSGEGTTVYAHTDQNGVVLFSNVWTSTFTAVDATDAKAVAFYDRASGTIVTSGNLSVNAGSNYRLNVEQVLAAFNQKYQAAQLNNGKVVSNSTNNGNGVYNNNLNVTSANDIASQLKAQGISVDNNGYFEAPKSFTVNFNATSQINNATATLPVTVTVPNGKEATPAQETTKNVKIMHISTIYDKDGKATNDAALRAYNTVSVVSDPVTINGAKFYKLAGKDQYIKVGNVDGTSRSLKHNSYVYKSSGKRANKKTLKKGSSVTTYGKSFMIAGHQMYRIGENQYVKKANF
ncbi:MAG: SLAP domain-containing protein, partial [Lactobacillus sp.]